MDNIPHTSENVYRLMREDDTWTKDALVDYIIDLEKIVHEWWEEKQKEYVKVVRCKDCRWRNDGFPPCRNGRKWQDSYYCADGVRKEKSDGKNKNDGTTTD